MWADDRCTFVKGVVKKIIDLLFLEIDKIVYMFYRRLAGWYPGILWPFVAVFWPLILDLLSPWRNLSSPIIKMLKGIP